MNERKRTREDKDHCRGKMDLYYAQRFLSHYYGSLGRLIAKHPYGFIIVPILLSAAAAPGILFMSLVDNQHLLYMPSDSYSMRSAETIDRLFPMNTSSNFSLSRMTTVGDWASVIITCNDGGSVLKEHIFMEITRMDEVFRNISVADQNGMTYNYSQLCAKQFGKCDENEILGIAWKISDIEHGRSYIKYPVDYSNVTYNYKSYIKNLGGVSTKENGEVTEAKAVRLFYYLRDSRDLPSVIPDKWMDAFVDKVGNMVFANVAVFPISSSMYENTIILHMRIAIPFGIISSVLIFVYSIVALMTTDRIKSKPWLAVSGLTGVVLSIVSTFGLLTFSGVHFHLMVSLVGFLALAIGMDDVFVLVAAWRRTNSSRDVIQRMGDAYSEAAVSITITSLSNMICFALGISMPFPIMKTFCTYATVIILILFIYQLTFFGGCMVLSGRREEKQLHPFTFRPVLQYSQNRRKPFDFVCPMKRDSPKSIGVQLITRFGQLASLPAAKCFLAVLYAGYLIASAIGILNLSFGLRERIIFPDNTPPLVYLKKVTHYFGEYTETLQVVIPFQLDYSNTTVQNYVENMMKTVESNPSTRPDFTESWLRYYLIFIKSELSKRPLSAYDISEKQDFIDALDNVFLKYPQTKHLRQDVAFNDNHTEIVASRFIVQTKGVSHSTGTAELVKSLKISLEPYPSVYFFSVSFPYHETLLTAKQSVVKLVSIAAATMFLILFIFIPDVRVSFCGLGQIISIQVGVIGFMAFWDVQLNIASVIFLAMCVGLSVDYTAHMCYIFTISKEKKVDGKVLEALDFLGVPIIEGSITTILAVFPLLFSRDESFEVFSKIILLVTVFSLLHAFCFLSLFLGFCNASFRRMSSVVKLKSHRTSENSSAVEDNEGEDSSKRRLTNVVNR